jgi:hypothetical protein
MKKALTLAITLALIGGCKQESGTKTGDSIPYTGPVWADPITSVNNTEHGVVPVESTTNTYNDETELKVLTANLGSSLTATDKAFTNAVAELVILNADIIFTQDAEGANARLAKALSMKLWAGQDTTSSVGILSKYPILEVLDTQGNPQIGAVLDVNGRQVVVWGNHLSNALNTSQDARGINSELNTPYENCAAINNTDQLDQITSDALRVKQAQNIVDVLAEYKASGTPIIFGGEFSEPSGLDWANAAINMFDHGGVVYDFPSHKLLRDAGYTDSYRMIHSNPETHPGITWPIRQEDSSLDSSKIVAKCGRALDDRDRVDFIYYDRTARDVTLNSATLIGPKTTQFFTSPDPTNPDPQTGYEDQHQGRLINSDTGTSRYEINDFPSTHLWYMATFTIATPAVTTEHISLDSTSEINIIKLEDVNNNLKVTFNIKDSLFMNIAFQYVVDVTASTEEPGSTIGGTVGVNGRPEVDDEYTVTISSTFLSNYKNRADVELRLTHNVSNIGRVDTIKTLTWEEIEAVVNVIGIEGPLPSPFSTNKTAYSVGETVTVDYHSVQGGSNDRVGIFDADSDIPPGANNPAVQALYIPAFEIAGSLSFIDLPAGNYYAALLYNDSFTVEETYDFEVVEGSVIATSKREYEAEEPVEVFFNNAPGNAKDWIAIYEVGADNMENLDWAYINGETKGSHTFYNTLSSGNYEIRLLTDDSFESIAVAEFSVN